MLVQAVKAAEDAAIAAAQAAQQAEAGGNPVDVVAKATLATTRCSQVKFPGASSACACMCLGHMICSKDLQSTL